MKNEIKEILEELEDCKITKYLNYNLDNKDARIILDYITNLQEENERLKNYYFKNANKYEELIEKYSNLQEEIEDKAYEQLKTQCFVYKSRITKAIDKLYCYGEVFDSKILQQFQKEMLETLQGDIYD